MVNILFDTVMLVPAYGTIAKIPVTFPPRPHAQESLTRIDFYMNGVISTVQDGAKRRHQVSDGTVRPQVDSPVLVRKYQGLVECKKSPGGGGRLDLHKRGPGVDGRHEGSNGHPPGAKSSGTLHTFGPSSNTTLGLGRQHLPRGSTKKRLCLSHTIRHQSTN